MIKTIYGLNTEHINIHLHLRVRSSDDSCFFGAAVAGVLTSASPGTMARKVQSSDIYHFPDPVGQTGPQGYITYHWQLTVVGKRPREMNQGGTQNKPLQRTVYKQNRSTSNETKTHYHTSAYWCRFLYEVVYWWTILGNWSSVLTKIKAQSCIIHPVSPSLHKHGKSYVQRQKDFKNSSFPPQQNFALHIPVVKRHKVT